MLDTGYWILDSGFSMLMIDNSPKGFPFRYKIIDDSLTIMFDLGLLALCPCCAAAYDLRFSADFRLKT